MLLIGKIFGDKEDINSIKFPEPFGAAIAEPDKKGRN
jgi:hypothetical protein